MITSYEVGAVFMIEDRATGPLAEIGRAFESLAEMAVSVQEKFATLGDGAFSGLLAGIDRAGIAMTRMLEQTDMITASWDRAAASAERYAAAAGAGGGAGAGGAGGAGGGGGGRGRRESDGPIGPPPRPYWGQGDDYRNAQAENANANQVYSREEAAARRENVNRDRAMNDGPIGPPVRPYWGQGDDWANAHAEDSNVNAVRDNERRMAEYEEADRNRIQTNERRAAEYENADRNRARRAAEAGGAGYLGGHAGGVFKGMMPLVGGLAAFEAEKAAMEEQQNLTQTLASLGIRPDNPRYEADLERMRALAFNETEGTKFSNAQAAKINRESLPILQIGGQAGIEAAEAVSPLALRLGEVSNMRGKGDPGHEAAAAIQFAHLTGHYKAEEITPTFDLINNVARANNTSIAEQESIMKYAVPVAIMAGISPDQAIASVSSAEARLGATSTAGTGYAQFILGGQAWHGQTGHGQSAHHRTQARAAEREFERIYRQEDPSGAANDKKQAEKALKEHDEFLVKLGVRDRSGKLLDVTPSGGFDESKYEQQIATFAATHTKDETTRMLTAVANVRGARYGEAYGRPGYIEQERRQTGELLHGTSVKDEMAMNAAQPLQQFQQMLGNIANTGNILATQTLQGLNTTFGVLNENLIKFNTWLSSHETEAKAAGYGLLGAGALTALGFGAAMMKPAVSGLRWLFGGGGGGAAAGEEAAAAGAGGGGGLLAGLGKLLPALAIGQDVQAHLADPKYINPATGEFDIRRVIGMRIPPPQLGGGDPEHHTGATPPASVNLTIHNVMNGVADAATYDGLLHKMTDSIRSMLEHATGGVAHGTTQSPYVTSGAL